MRRSKLRRFIIPSAVTLPVLVLGVWLLLPSQEGDPSFDARVERPAHTAWHPRVLFDEAHYNVHTAHGRYKPFADLIRNDGYVVASNSERLSADVLRGHDALVIANALGVWGAAQQLANIARLEGRLHLAGSAFTDAETAAVEEWVRTGGSLLLIADHAPAGESAGALARRFGVEMTNWYAEDEKHHDPETGSWSFLVFSEDNGLLGDHPILRGREESERIRKVMTFTGQSLRSNPPAVGLLSLSSMAVEFPCRASANTEARPASGLSQAVALTHGAGRVVILGEAAALTAQVAVAGDRAFKFGMSRDGVDNRQFALNIMRWLTGLLE